MKNLFTKLALFIFISIMLAMPLQAFAELNDCISDENKKNFIIKIVEEAFGDPTNSDNIVKNDKSYQSITCCRKTDIATTVDGPSSVANLNRGPCGKCEPTEIEGPPNPDTTLTATCEEVMVILSTGGTSMIEGYIASIYTWAASIVGLIAVTVIIISGIQIAVSGGDTQAVDSGKNRIIKSISGLAVLFLSGLILYTINPNFFTK
ncbi:MAG: pilin [Candidatus Gracilibacteria bacterium]